MERHMPASAARGPTAIIPASIIAAVWPCERPGERQLILDLVAAPAPTLENFLAGRNAELRHGLRAWPNAGWSRVRSSSGARRKRAHSPPRGLVEAVRNGAGGGVVACADAPHCTRSCSGWTALQSNDVERLAPGEQVASVQLYNALKERGAAIAVSGMRPQQQLSAAHLATAPGWGLAYQLHALWTRKRRCAPACEGTQ